MYYTTKIQGQPLSTYTLKVIVDNKTYISQSTIPKPVILDSLTTEISASFGGKKNSTAVANYQDPADVANFYRFVKTTNNDQQSSSYSLQNDTYNNGQNVHKTLRGNLKKGDILKVEMSCIDKNVYQYFYTLNQSSGGLGGTNTPSNPESNISGGCLGYFNAQSISTQTIIGK